MASTVHECTSDLFVGAESSSVMLSSRRTTQSSSLFFSPVFGPFTSSHAAFDPSFVLIIRAVQQWLPHVVFVACLILLHDEVSPPRSDASHARRISSPMAPLSGHGFLGHRRCHRQRSPPRVPFIHACKPARKPVCEAPSSRKALPSGMWHS